MAGVLNTIRMAINIKKIIKGEHCLYGTRFIGFIVPYSRKPVIKNKKLRKVI